LEVAGYRESLQTLIVGSDRVDWLPSATSLEDTNTANARNWYFPHYSLDAFSGTWLGDIFQRPLKIEDT
jgi:hypothetical protein